MKRCLIFLILFISFNLVHAQLKMRNNWYFGNKAGINFSSGTATELKDNPNEFNVASASISDSVTGKLIFYTDGQNVFSSDHSPMQGGSQLLPDNFYCWDALIVPDVVSPSKYYIFSVQSVTSLFFYSQVDMSLNNGKGAVIKRGVFLSDSINNKITAVRYINNKGWWVITHRQRGNGFVAYLVTAEGVNHQPVVSNIGAPLDMSKDIEGLVSNHKGTHIAVSHYAPDAIVEVYDFDKICGKLSNTRRLTKQPGWDHALGLSYSLNDENLYVTYSVGLSTLVQYNALNNYTSSVTLLTSPGNLDGMRLGADGRIYLLSGTEPGVADVIRKPDAKSAACDYRNNDFVFTGGRSGDFFLPNFIEDFTIAPSPVHLASNDYCIGLPSVLKAVYHHPYQRIHWKLTGNNISEEKDGDSLIYTFTIPGSYQVELIGFNCMMNDTIRTTINVKDAPKPILGNDTTVCKNAGISLASPLIAEKYLWNTGDTSSQIVTDTPGIYWLRTTNGVCANADSIEVKQYEDIMTALGDEYFICEDDRELVKLDAGEGFQQYKWTPTGDSTQWIVVETEGPYYVVVKDFRGCPGEDGTKVERRCGVRLYFPNAFTPNANGLNEVFRPGGQDVTDYHLTIFNRWGVQVFTSDDLYTGWNGMVNGKYAPEGTYVYTCTYKGFQSKRLVEKSSSGKFTLIR